MKPALVPRLPGARRARYWNWHNVAGVWISVPLLVVALTGVIIALPWANTLLFRMAGSPLPAPPGRDRAAGMIAPLQEGARKTGSAEKHLPSALKEASANLDKLFAIACRRQSEWHSILVRLPESPLLL